MREYSARRKIWIKFIDRLGHWLGLRRTRPLPLPEQVRSILVLELWGLGDVVLATAGLAGLRKWYPNAKITLLAQRHAPVLLENCPWPDQILTFSFPWTAYAGKYRLWSWPWKKLFRIIRYLRSQNYDLAVSARGDIRDHLVLWLSGAAHRAGYAAAGGGAFLTQDIREVPGREHRVHAWQDLLTALGAEGRAFEPGLCLSAAETQAARHWVAELDIRPGTYLLAAHPGAGRPIRQWPVKKFAQAMAQVSAEVRAQWIVLGAPGNADSDRLADQVPGAIRVSGGLRDLLALLGQCDMLLCNDSGPMHMAAALGVPAAAVFGPQKPEWFGPWGNGHQAILHPDVPCRGCFDQCTQLSRICLDEVDPDQAARAVLTILRGRSARHNTVDRETD